MSVKMSHKPVNVMIDASQWHCLKIMATREKLPVRDIVCKAFKLYLAQDSVMTALNENTALAESEP